MTETRPPASHRPGSRRRPVVLVSGYLGAGNVGDEAIFHVLSRHLMAHGIDVHAASLDPAATMRMHGVRSWHRTRGLVPAIAACDAVVSGGGGLLQDRTSARSLAYYLAVLSLAKALRKPAFVYGQSLGPLSAQGRRRVARVLRGVPVWVRDESSLALATAMHLDARLVDDPATLLLDVSPGDGSEPPTVGTDDRLLLIPRGDVHSATAAMTQVARAWTDAGRSVAVASLDRHDVEAASTIAAAARVDAVLVRSPDEAVTLMRTVGHVASVRLHGLVFASAAGLRHVGVVYDPKVSGFLDRSGGVAVAPPVSVDALLDALSTAPVPAAGTTQRLADSARDGLDALARAVRLAAPHDGHAG